MKDPKKIQAFTLGEMIVVLIITSIVIGMAYTVLSLVQKQMLAIQHNYEQQLLFKKFETSLWLDMSRYNTIVYNDAEDTLVFSNEIDSITYEFKDDLIIKASDTILVPLAKKEFFFNGIETIDQKIDAMKLYSTTDFQSQELFIFKYNDANSYLKP